MAFQYRLYCTIHGYQYVWSDTLVTECPVNPADPINQDATCIVNQLRPAIQFAPTTTSANLSQPIRMGDIYYDMATMGTLSRIGIFSYCEKGVTSYSVEVYDKTNLKSLGKKSFSNKDDYVLNYIDNITQIDAPFAMLEIFVNVSATISKKKAYVSRVILYTY